MNLLSIIIVNYRSAQLLSNCLKTVVRANAALPMEVIVVDNHSGDDSRELIESRFSFVQWISMPYNAGFARANNAGMKVAKGDAVLLLNPDTLAVDDSISTCYRQLMAADYVAAGVRQLTADGGTQISGHYFVRGGLNHLLPLPYWGALVRRLALGAGAGKPHAADDKTVAEVDWISGAFLMVKKTAIAGAGLMDEDFFLYAEEVEWCYRLGKVGRLCIYNHLKIIHLEGATINKEQDAPEKGYYNLYDKKGLQLMVSNHLRVRKQYGVGSFLFLLTAYSGAALTYFPLSVVHRLLTFRNPVAEAGTAFRFLRNMSKLWQLTPKIIQNKPHFYKLF